MLIYKIKKNFKSISIHEFFKQLKLKIFMLNLKHTNIFRVKLCS